MLTETARGLSKSGIVQVTPTAASSKSLSVIVQAAERDLRQKPRLIVPDLKRRLRRYVPLLKKVRKLVSVLGRSSARSGRTAPSGVDANLLGDLAASSNALLGDALGNANGLTAAIPNVTTAVSKDLGGVTSSVTSAAANGSQALLTDLRDNEGTIRGINSACAADGFIMAAVSLAQGGLDPVSDGVTGVIGACSIITGGMLLIVEATGPNPNLGRMALDAGSMVAGSAIEYAGTVSEIGKSKDVIEQIEKDTEVAGDVVNGVDQGLDTVAEGNSAPGVVQLSHVGASLGAAWKKIAATAPARSLGASALLANIHAIQRILALLSPSSAAPKPISSTIAPGQTSLTLPSGAGTYIFGYANGGAFPSSPFSTGQVASVTDADGFTPAALALTSSNVNSFTTETAYYSVAGVGVSHYGSVASYSGSNAGPGAALSASVSFPVSVPGSMVEIVALGGDMQCLSLGGDLPSLHTDASATMPYAITLARAYPAPGSYTVTEDTNQCYPGQDPSHAGDLIGAFVFTP